MLPFFLKIRLLQFSRILDELGLARVVLLGIIVIPFLIRTISYGYYFLVFWIAALLFLHLVRPDRRFLRMIDVPTYVLFVGEYLLLSLPLIGVYIFGRQWMVFLPLLLILLIPLLPFSVSLGKAGNIRRRSFFPADAFEWISGWRKNFIQLLLIYAAGLALSFYEVSVPVALLLLTLSTTSFYLEFESREMLEAFHLKPSAFLRRKCARQLQIFWTACIPLLLAFLIFFHHHWYILPLVMLLSSVIQIFTVAFKYATYEPHESAQMNVVVYVLFVAGIFLSFTIPFFMPVVVMMLIRYYRRAVANLENYL